MISELRDDEILDFLMTSEFENDYKPEEWRYLMHKWRYFYRLSFGKSESKKIEYEGEIKKLSDELDMKKNETNSLMVKCADKDNIIESIKSRKLTIWERISGKIII